VSGREWWNRKNYRSHRRDGQKSKVYRAETEAEQRLFPKGAPPYTIVEAQGVANLVLYSEWCLERFGDRDAQAERSAGLHAACRYQKGVYILLLPAIASDRLTVFHELAHALTWQSAPWHGAYFCRVLLETLREFWPSAYPVLLEEYRRFGVRYSMTRPERSTPPVTSHFIAAKRKGT
jgi:hypothetical protein